MSELNPELSNEILRALIVMDYKYCNSGMYNGKYFVQLKGYVSPELLEYLNSLPPIERDPPIKINMRSKYPDT